ncbi:hypothetical protein M5X00_25855 [Paenibacillus alvei]|uniref:hypothetical protein n=1 Tax=Paenibacillus alvei TaxID=44250 RepID=UPI00227FAB64|nr:hypothetical protein [Paenibacillus alvei]MCY9757655.1 hypothetical protein [Paenibacillus alvei]
MSKKSKYGNLSPEYIEKIRVKPEDTAKRLASLPYTITPRPDEKPPKGMMWCPYEAKWSKFISPNPLSPMSTYLRCETCGISIEDYYTKTVNKLWGDKDERK